MEDIVKFGDFLKKATNQVTERTESLYNNDDDNKSEVSEEIIESDIVNSDIIEEDDNDDLSVLESMLLSNFNNIEIEEIEDDVVMNHQVNKQEEISNQKSVIDIIEETKVKEIPSEKEDDDLEDEEDDEESNDYVNSDEDNDDDFYKLYSDKSEEFVCDISIEGADPNDSEARIVIESEDWNLLFYGELKNGKCIIPIRKLNILKEGDTGNIRLEVIAENNLFIPWEDKFKVKLSKKVTVRLNEQKNSKNKKPIVKGLGVKVNVRK